MQSCNSMTPVLTSSDSSTALSHFKHSCRPTNPDRSRDPGSNIHQLISSDKGYRSVMLNQDGMSVLKTGSQAFDENLLFGEDNAKTSCDIPLSMTSCGSCKDSHPVACDAGGVSVIGCRSSHSPQVGVIGCRSSNSSQVGVIGCRSTHSPQVGVIGCRSSHSSQVGVIGCRSTHSPQVGVIGCRSSHSSQVGVIECRSSHSPQVGVIGCRSSNSSQVGVIGCRSTHSSQVGVIGCRSSHSPQDIINLQSTCVFSKPHSLRLNNALNRNTVASQEAVQSELTFCNPTSPHQSPPPTSLRPAGNNALVSKFTHSTVSSDSASVSEFKKLHARLCGGKVGNDAAAAVVSDNQRQHVFVSSVNDQGSVKTNLSRYKSCSSIVLGQPTASINKHEKRSLNCIGVQELDAMQRRKSPEGPTSLQNSSRQDSLSVSDDGRSGVQKVFDDHGDAGNHPTSLDRSQEHILSAKNAAPIHGK